MEERRIFERFKVGFKVKFLNLNTNKEGAGKMVNISAGGGGMVVTEECLRPSITLKMQFCIADDKDPFYANGKVIWSRMIEPGAYMAGIQFEKVDFMGIARALRIHS